MADLTTRLSNFLSTLATGVSVPGVLSSQITSVGNVGTGEDDLMTYSLPANTLSSNGQGLRIRAWGTIAGNTNAKTLKFYFGSATPISIVLRDLATTGNLVTGQWLLEALVIRLAASSQNVVVKFVQLSGGTADIRDQVIDMNVTSTTQAETAAITVKCTATATSDNDITQSGLLIEGLL